MTPIPDRRDPHQPGGCAECMGVLLTRVNDLRLEIKQDIGEIVACLTQEDKQIGERVKVLELAHAQRVGSMTVWSIVCAAIGGVVMAVGSWLLGKL